MLTRAESEEKSQFFGNPFKRQVFVRVIRTEFWNDGCGVPDVIRSLGGFRMLAPLQKHLISGSSPIALREIKETADLAVLKVEKVPTLNSFDRKMRISLVFGEKIGTWCSRQKIHQLRSGRVYCFTVDGARDAKRASKDGFGTWRVLNASLIISQPPGKGSCRMNVGA